MSPAKPPGSTRRRALSVLVGTAVPFLAGCVSSDPPATRRSPPPSTRRTATPTSTPSPTDTDATPGTTDEGTPAHYRKVEFLLVEVSAGQVAEGVLRGTKYLDAYEADLIDAAVADGSTTFSATSFEPLRERIYVRRDAYYEITRTVVDERSVTAHNFDVDAITTCRGETPEVTEEPVPSADLPPTDRRTFLRGTRDLLDDDGCFTAGRKVYYPPDAAANSTFIADSPTFVRHDGEVYVVRHEGTREMTLTEYHFDATLLGETRAEYVARVVPDVVWRVDADALPDAEREFFERLLRDGSYSRENPIPEVVDAFVGRMYDNVYAAPGEYYVSFEDDYYRLEYTQVQS